MTAANREQAEHWNREESGHWVTHQARYDRMLEPFAALLLEAASFDRADRVLDVGCGCGATSLAAAQVASEGETVGIDLSVAMLDRARSEALAAGVGNVSFIEGDAQVFPFGPARFDAVISRFGVMFFDDPVAAFTNLRRATKPAARLAFVCWQPMAANRWLLVPGAALAEHVPLPDLGSSDGPGMFALSDPDRVRAILTDAGWHGIAVTPASTSMLLAGGGTLDEAVEFLRTGSMGRTLLADVEPDTEARAVGSVRSALAPFVASDGVRLDAAVWLVSAVA
jgi:SAM-dependent methyltransferase